MKKLTAVLLSLLIILSATSAYMLVAAADDDDTSGELGDSITWTVDTTETKLRITGTGDMPSLTEDGEPWIYQKDHIEYVEISDGITSISAGAFAGLDKLQVVTIPASVETIEGSAFADCPRLVQFIVKSGNKNFLANDVNSTYGILYNIDKTAIVRFPASCTLLTSKVTTFTLPETVKTIGDYAFEGCTTLTELNFGKTGQLESVGDYAFADCTALKTFDCTYQPGLNEIGDYAFSNCTALSDVKLWNTLDKTLAGSYIFNGCKSFSGFVFYGTKTEFGNTNIAIPDGSTTHFVNTDTLIKAYYIRYDANGGTISSEYDIVIDGNDTTITSLVPVKTDFTFIGWAKTASATTADSTYAAGASYAASNGNIRLYAVYGSGMALTFDANGGTGAPKAITFSSKGNLTIPSVTPSRSGYTFLGWSKSSSATTPSYTAGSTIAVDSSVTLYAVWESTGPYDITYYNGTTLIAADKGVKTKNVAYTIARTATKTPSSRYEFIGWATTDGGNVVYTTGSSYTGNENLVLYAVFKDNGPYDVYIHYDMNDYNVYTKLSQSSKGESVTLNVSPVEYDGWEFLGWSENYYAETVDYAAGSAIIPTADVNLYPCVKMVNYTEGSGFEFNGGTKTVNYKNKVCITADAYNLPSGYGIAVYDGRSLVAFAPADEDGHAALEWTTDELTSGVTYTVKVTRSGASAGESFTGSDGRVLSGKITIIVNDNIFLRIIAFFRSLFGSQPTVTI